MIVYVSTDDLFAAAADISEGREVEWMAEDGTTVTLRVARTESGE
jgi:hypothetical protein